MERQMVSGAKSCSLLDSGSVYVSGQEVDHQDRGLDACSGLQAQVCVSPLFHNLPLARATRVARNQIHPSIRN